MFESAGSMTDNCVCAVACNVAERKEKCEEFRARERMFQTLAENIPDIIVRYDTDCRRVYCNPAHGRATGLPPSAFIGKTPNEYWAMAMPTEPYQEKLKRVLETGIADEFELSWPGPGGSSLCLLIRFSPEFDGDGKTVSVLAIGRDITVRKKAVEELLATQKQLAAMTVELSLAEERERRRIASELHDRIGQTLLLARIKLGMLAASLPDGEGENPLEEIRGLFDEAIRDVRSLTVQLSPPILDGAGLEAALEWLAKRIEADYGLKVEFIDDMNEKPLSGEIRSILYQAARELLINVTKHAMADSARLVIRKNAATLILSVEDAGCGFNFADAPLSVPKEGCFGLFNIRQRITHLGGEVAIDSDRGTRVTIRMPLLQEG